MVHGKDAWPTTPSDWNTASPVDKKGPSVFPWQLAGDFVPFDRGRHVEQAGPNLGTMAVDAESQPQA
ncbi:hypothetical protein KDA14_00115, partial [Candidatus Saccharibacteria bacterium]|nr:hypothetical protein [Candidatus Saccharibacteria bacterium]